MAKASKVHKITCSVTNWLGFTMIGDVSMKFSQKNVTETQHTHESEGKRKFYTHNTHSTLQCFHQSARSQMT